MVAPSNDPQALARRMRRLEVLLFGFLIASGDEADEEHLWHDLRHLLRRQRDEGPFFDSPHLEYFVERLIETRRRSTPESMGRRIQELETEVQRLSSQLQSLQIDSHTIFSVQSLGLDTAKVKTTRFLPVRAYIEKTPPGAIEAVAAAVEQLLSAYGFTVADEFPPIKGSWFKKWFAKSKDALSHPEVTERLEKIERAVELRTLEKPQSDVDEKKAAAIARVIEALNGTPTAAIQAGSVLVVKVTTAAGPMIQARTLTQDEITQLENNQLLLQNPAEVLGRLSEACLQNRMTSALKSSDDISTKPALRHDRGHGG
ncbi:hypothetical protein [Sinimarinibacterium flocculans]|uniref:hypothetical protein n=1 Tax=Sinimarinibacterium flocculans TaxID=985250 RepID=UPI003516A082